MARPLPRRIWFLFVASVVILAACGSDAASTLAPTPTLRPGTPDVRPRTFQMGMSSLPPQLTDASYADTFELIGGAGDVVLIQRAPPWPELLSGDISASTGATTQREVKLARDNGLDIFFAIDPTDPATGRSELADLPSDLAGARFADKKVRDALLTYARYVATNYKPKYLAFGVEINSYQRAQALDFEQFVLLYHEAYRAVKELSPGTLMFPTFQLEDMQGYLPLDAPKAPQWYLLSRFGADLDMLAVSSYPRSVFRSIDNLPADYFSQLKAYTKKPIALVSTGYPSAPESDDSTEALQATYMLRMLNYAQALSMSLVVWFVSQDPTFSGDAPYDRLQYLGLRRQDGTPKQAWDIWGTVARRPLAKSSG
jgi:hypothetical protein